MHPRAASAPRGRSTGASKGYSSNGLASNPSNPDSTSTEPVDEFSRAEMARKDLLALGIELDNDLIKRLQHNLGTKNTFAAASKAANVVRHRNNSSKDSAVRYRHHSPSAFAAKFMGSMENGGNSNMHSGDIVKAVNLLYDRNSILDPQIRSGLLKIVDHLQILFTRSPDKFMRAICNGAVEELQVRLCL